MRSHSSVFYHLKESAPNKGSTQKVFNVVDVFNEEVQ
jgi:hypothetical protein